ncbi:MAG TPA: type IV pili twitching motility protein PilT, partial [Gammaproteobacteria bacterium]|nr:type IV pili twitching motility protein PilT [Gammaproteobacteria bacterium]
RSLEMNLAIGESGVGRFRVNIFKQRGEVSMVIRYIKGEIPQVEELGLPPLLRQIIMEKRGMILLVGGTGSGKSTTLAAMIDHRNTSSPGHIITIEDPIEFTHQHKKSVIAQREIGIDTHSYEFALRSAMREAPDVILVGEIRERDVMKFVLTFSETGHLVLSTLHANNANGALERIVNFFPEDARPQLLMDLALNLKAIISQRLIRSLTGGVVPAVEVLLNTPYIADLIQKGKIDYVKDAMEQSTESGTQTFDQALFKLYKDGKISKDEAIKNADSKNNVALQIRLAEGMESGGSSKKSSVNLADLALDDDDDKGGRFGI